ncbi:MAG TPA: adenosylcobinamide-GDP ribazoletransferase [Candidatus Baltobacteraceae bacterium]|nr:adenosylcobinamide-GDP ribazoletransferase [Candidatus Baltobacteraceae bacterium]
MRLLRAFGAAFSYFSILPGPSYDGAADDDAIAFLPFVGLLIGALAGLGGYGSAQLTHSPIAAAIAAWLLTIALSGAIHLDGFLDCADGLFAMRSAERRLEIMHDPRHGTYAIVGMAMLSVVWLYALAQIPAPMLPVTLALTGFFARWSAVGPRTIGAMLPGAVLAVALLVLLHNHRAAVLIGVVIALATSFVVELFARRRLSGVISGDCYGAAIVVSEVALLLSFPYLVALR